MITRTSIIAEVKATVVEKNRRGHCIPRSGSHYRQMHDTGKSGDCDFKAVQKSYRRDQRDCILCG